MAGFAGYVALRAVFLWLSAGAFVVDNRDTCMAGFAGDDAYLAVFSLFLGRPEILGIMVGMEVEDRYAVTTLVFSPLPQPLGRGRSGGVAKRLTPK